MGWRIRGSGATGWRERVGAHISQALFTEARTPQGSGPFCFSFQPGRHAAPTPQFHASPWAAPAVIAPQGIRFDPGVFINNLPRGVAGHWTGAPSPHDADPGPRPGVRSISGVSSPHRRGSAAWTVWRDVQERGPLLCSDVDGAVRLARGSSREGTTEMDSSSPGDGTGIRVRLRSGILGVRLSPGTPIFSLGVMSIR